MEVVRDEVSMVEGVITEQIEGELLLLAYSTDDLYMLIEEMLLEVIV